MDPSPGFVTPARWDYHPPAPTAALASVKLPDGGCAFTAEGGAALDRPRRPSRRAAAWSARARPRRAASRSRRRISPPIDPARRRPPGSTSARTAARLLRRPPSRSAPSPAPCAAPEPLAKVVGVGSAVLAATLQGRLLRREAANGWRAASTSPAIAGARVFDLAAGSGGRVLALGFPEALFASEDGGATLDFGRGRRHRAGARRLGRTRAAAISASRASSSRWCGAPDRASFAAGAPRRSRGSQARRSTSEAGARALGRGRGAGGARRARRRPCAYEVVRPENEGDLWLMARGRIEERLETVPIGGSERCGSVRLGARGRVVFIACVFTEGGSGEIVAEVRRSVDAATTWSDPLRLATPDTDQITISVSADGSAAGDRRVPRLGHGRRLQAERAAPAPADPRRRRRRARRRSDAGHDGGRDGSHDGGDDGGHDGWRYGAPPAPSTLRAFPVERAAALRPRRSATAFGADGHTAYFLGKRGKDDRTGLFVSHDGGETFSPRAVPGQGRRRAQAAQRTTTTPRATRRTRSRSTSRPRSTPARTGPSA